MKSAHMMGDHEANVNLVKIVTATCNNTDKKSGKEDRSINADEERVWEGREFFFIASSPYEIGLF